MREPWNVEAVSECAVALGLGAHACEPWKPWMNARRVRSLGKTVPVAVGEGARNSQHFRRIHVVLPLAHAFITPGVPDESTRCVLPGSWHPLLASPPSAPALAPALGVAALGASLYLLGVARVASTDERDLLDADARPAPPRAPRSNIKRSRTSPLFRLILTLPQF